MEETVLKQVTRLPKLSCAELKARWRSLYGTEPPGHNRAYMVRRLAYRIQISDIVRQAKVGRFLGYIAGASHAPLVVGHYSEFFAGQPLQVAHIVTGQARPAVDGDQYLLCLRIASYADVQRHIAVAGGQLLDRYLIGTTASRQPQE